jgi:hypothetical protein
MKLMTTISNSQNKMQKDSPHSLEEELHEPMKKKIHAIQFESISNVIQMKSLKVIDNSGNISDQQFQHHDQS